MPNWCTNILTINGSKSQMSKFYQRLKNDVKGNFRMTNFLPLPDELENTVSQSKFIRTSQREVEKENGIKKVVHVDENGLTEEEYERNRVSLIEKYGYDNWYDWQCHNWGCKWDIEKINIINKDKEILKIWYFTANSPNQEFIFFLGGKFPELEFNLEYDDLSIGYAGKFFGKNDQFLVHDLPIYNVRFYKCSENQNQYVFKFNYQDYFSSDSDGDFEDVFIFGNKWEYALSHTLNDYSQDNVINWKLFKQYVEEIDKAQLKYKSQSIDAKTYFANLKAEEESFLSNFTDWSRLLNKENG